LLFAFIPAAFLRPALFDHWARWLDFIPSRRPSEAALARRLISVSNRLHI
jgi:hypothetical protein